MIQSQPRKDRRTGTRVNLTLPPDVDAILTRLADAAGTGKASFVREWLVSMTPQLAEMARALEMARQGQADGLTVMAGALRASVHKAEQSELELKELRRRAMPRLKAKDRK
jgi:hypothetical protein